MLSGVMPFDIGIGILLGLWFAPFGDHNSSNIWLGIMFVLLPDIDILIYYGLKVIGRRKLTRRFIDHRDMLHYPLLYLTLGTLVVAAMNPHLVLLFVVCILVHFLHDSIGIGWGIPWLWPLNHIYYKFLYQYDLQKANKPRQLVWAWSRTEQETLSQQFGDQDWDKHSYQIWKYAPMWRLGEIATLLIGILALLHN